MVDSKNNKPVLSSLDKVKKLSFEDFKQWDLDNNYQGNIDFFTFVLLVIKAYYKYKLGFEYHLDSKITNNTIFLRLGLNYLNNDFKCALGFGMPFEINDSMILNVDYALDPGLVNEGISHLFSFSLLNY